MSFRIDSMGISLGAIRPLRQAEYGIARSSARSARQSIPSNPRRHRFHCSKHQFGTFKPLNEDTLQIVLAVGITAGDTITVSGVDATATGVGAGGLDVATATGAGTSITALDTAIGNASALAAQFGIAENRLESRSRLLGVQIEATSAAESRIRDVDYALESALLARNQILQESAIAVIGQANANMSMVLRLLGQ
jgi:flagellin-like hook-associated protein FlgL